MLVGILHTALMLVFAIAMQPVHSSVTQSRAQSPWA